MALPQDISDLREHLNTRETELARAKEQLATALASADLYMDQERGRYAGRWRFSADLISRSAKHRHWPPKACFPSVLLVQFLPV